MIRRRAAGACATSGRAYGVTVGLVLALSGPAVPGPAAAQAAGDTVRLSGAGGALSVEGDLLGYDGSFFRIETPQGLLVVDASAVTCEGACPDPGIARITVSGDAGATSRLLPALLRAYAEPRGLTVEEARGRVVLSGEAGAALEIGLRGTGTEEGFADLLTGEADATLARRPVRTLEAALARDAGLGDMRAPARARALVPDALAVVVASGNPVRSLTLPQLAALFAGALTDWSDLPGGGSGPVRLHLPAEASAAAQGFEDAVMERAGLPLAPEGVVRHDDPEDLSRAVAADPGAIGVTWRDASGTARAVLLGGGCAPPVGPDPFGTESGDYPLAVPLTLYLPALPLPEPARDFAAWLLSPEARGAAEAAEAVQPRPAPRPFARDIARISAGIGAARGESGLAALQSAVTTLEGLSRLPETFRFEDGSARLDATGESAARSLAARLREGEFDGTRLLFAGFSDATGPADERLSRLRAALVRDHVAELAGGAPGVRLETAGLGAALPVACPDTVWGRHANRRVELWVEGGKVPAEGSQPDRAAE